MSDLLSTLLRQTRPLLVLGVIGLAPALLALSLNLQAEPGQPPAGPQEAWKTSPFHGVTDGNGQIIPCLCLYHGQKYRLGEVVCMNTHVGTVMTRCDLFLNNTSWVPTSVPCTLS
jgi:hypothetical protein